MSHFQFAQSGEAHFAGGNKSQIHLIRPYFLLSCQKYTPQISSISEALGERCICVTSNSIQLSPANLLKSFLHSSTCFVTQCPSTKKKKKKDSNKTNREVDIDLSVLQRKVIKRVITVPVVQF